MKYLNQFFKRNIRNVYTVDEPELLKSIQIKNRRTLSSVPKWLSEEQSNNSYFNYGVPDQIKNLIDLEIGDEITYTDLLLYYSRKFKNINYLELGVSVGKNFLQLANQLDKANLTGFDIENINTPLKERFQYLDKAEWETLQGSLRKEKSNMTYFKFNTNSIVYLAGDIWDEKSWSKLKGQKFNIIFSDALHDPKALLWEYEMVKKYNLLDDDFIYIWDDLNNGLEESFKTIAKDLKKQRKLSHDQISLIKINGWLGQNYPTKHDIGIVSNLILN